MATPPGNHGHQQSAGEIERLKSAIGNAISAWAEIDRSLCFLLNEILSMPDYSYGIAVYYVPVASEIRISMVDAAVMHWMEQGHPLGGHIVKVWKKIVSGLHKCRKARNEIAHGEINVWIINGKAKVRLTGPSIITYAIDGQFPGQSVHDLQQSSKKFQRYAEIVGRFTHVVQVSRDPSADRPKLLEAFQQLTSHLTTPSAQSCDQTPPKPEDPHGSSGE